MLVSDGCSRTRFVGLVFDGALTAAVGFEHDAHAPGMFETRIRHQNSKFVRLQLRPKKKLRLGPFLTNFAALYESTHAV